MRFISWKKIHSWNCLACGECCRLFNIPLRGNEYAKVLQTIGSNVLNYEHKPGRIYLKRRKNGQCVLQAKFYGKSMCTIQGCKPLVCKLFPFLISKTGKKRGRFFYKGHYYNVFVDRNCNGLKYGTPNRKLINTQIPEAIELSLNPANNVRENTYKNNLNHLMDKNSRINLSSLTYIDKF